MTPKMSTLNTFFNAIVGEDPELVDLRAENESLSAGNASLRSNNASLHEHIEELERRNKNTVESYHNTTDPLYRKFQDLEAEDENNRATFIQRVMDFERQKREIGKENEALRERVKGLETQNAANITGRN